MAETKAGSLYIEILTKIDKVIADLATVKNTASSAMASVEKSVNAAKTALAGLGLTLGVGAFTAMIKGAIDAADHINDLSKSTGIAVEQLAGLKIAAKQSGGDLDSIAASINKLSVNIGKSGEKFAALGITTKDPLEAFKQLADVFSAIQDPQLRAALGAEALGKKWEGAAPLLAEGGAKIGEMVERGTQLVGVTKEMAIQSDAFNDKLAELTGTGGLMNRAVADLLPLLNTLADNMLSVQKASDATSTAASPLLEVFRVVVVLGGNVAFVIKGIGTELETLGKQFVAFTTRDFAGFKRIHEEAIANAEKARSSFDAWERSIMAVGTSAQTAADKINNMDQASRRLQSITESEARTAAKAAEEKARGLLEYEKRMKAAEDAYKKWLAEEKRLRELDAKDWVKYIEAQTDEYERGLNQMAKDSEAFWKAEAKLAEIGTKGTIDAFEAETEAYENFLRSQADGKPTITASYGELAKLTAQVEFETKLLGLSNVERAKAIALRDAEANGIDLTSEALQRYLDALDAQEAKQKMLDFTKAFQDITKGLADALVSAWEQGKLSTQTFMDWLKQQFAKLVLRPVVQYVVNAAGGAVLSLIGGSAAAGTGGDASGIGSLFNLASGISSANSASSGLSWLQNFFGFGAGAAPAVGGQAGATGAGAAAFGGSALADGAGFWTAAGSYGSLATAGGVFGTAAVGAIIGGLTSSFISKDPDASRNGMIGGAAGSVIGAWVAGGTAVGGPWGAVIGAVIGGVIAAFTDMDGPAARTARVVAGQHFDASTMTYGMESSLGGLGIQRGSDKWFSDSAQGPTLVQWFAAIRDMDNSIAARLSATQLAAARTAVGGQNQNLFFGMEEQDMDPAAFGQIIKDRYGRLFGAIDSAMGALVTGFEGTIGDLMKLIDDLAAVNFQLTANAAEYARLFGESINFGDLQELQKSGETFSQTLIRLSSVFYATNTVALLVGKTQEQVWGAVGLATTGGREQLIEFAGGMEQFTSQLTAYYDKYYTDAEKFNLTQQQLTSSFSALGVAMPESTAGFRALVEAQDLTTEAGRRTFAALMAIAPTFYDFSQQIKGLDGVLYDAAEAIKSHRDLWDMFATDAQKLAQATLEVNAGFERLGLSVPKSREEFANYIASIDTTTASGRALVDALRLLAPSLQTIFNQVTDFVQGTMTLPSLMGGSMGSGSTASNAGINEYLARRTAAIKDWQDQLDVISGRRTQIEIDRERAIAAVVADLGAEGSKAVTALMEQVYAQQDLNAAMARARQMTLDFGAAMDRLHGNDAYSRFFAQSQATSTLGAVTSAMPWIHDLNQLMSMSIDDFGQYSAANQQLILDALNAAAALQGLSNVAASTAVNLGGGEGMQWVSNPDGTGYWRAIAAPSSGSTTDPNDLLLQKYRTQLEIFGLQGNNIGDKTPQGEMMRNYRKMIQDIEESRIGDAGLRLLTHQLNQLKNAAEDSAEATARAAEALAARTRIEDYLKASAFSATSPLTDAQRLMEARSQYAAQLGLAQGGDVTALGKITDFAEQYKTAAQSVYGHGGPFSAIWQGITADLQTLAIPPDQPTAGDTYVASEISTAIHTANDAILTENRKLRDDVCTLLEQIREQSKRGDNENADATRASGDQVARTIKSAAPDKVR